MHTADGDASPATIRSYHSNAAQFVAWCGEHGINPATVTEDDIATYGRELVAQYEVGTVAVKLAAIRRLYEAAVWRGLRQDNPAVSADNNEAERALRPAVVTHKTSFGSRSKGGAQDFARLLSLIQSWERQGKDFFTTARHALGGGPSQN